MTTNRFIIREAVREDLQAVLELYLHLHEDTIPEGSEHLRNTWERIMRDNDHHLLFYELDSMIVSSCVCVIIPHLTRGVRPYAFIENVVTHADYRGRGYAHACLDHAHKIALENGCYKMMLLTGSKDPDTHRFYEKAGYNSSDKTAYIKWL